MLLRLQTKLTNRALKSLDGLWVPQLARFKMKEEILTSIDVPIIQKEADVVLEKEFRENFP